LSVIDHEYGFRAGQWPCQSQDAAKPTFSTPTRQASSVEAVAELGSVAEAAEFDAHGGAVGLVL
jgi:hypothetical protein